MQMEQVTSSVHLQIPGQPLPGEPTWPRGDAGPRLGSPEPCEQPGAVLETSVAIFLMVVAGAVILILGCVVLLFCYRHRWGNGGSLQYINFYHSARYTLKEPCPSPPPLPAPRPASLPPALPLPPPPPSSTPPPSFHPALQPSPFHSPRPPLHPASPLIHTTPPSPLLPSADMVVYSRIGLMRTSRPPSASGSATQVILFEHSSL